MESKPGESYRVVVVVLNGGREGQMLIDPAWGLKNEFEGSQKDTPGRGAGRKHSCVRVGVLM